MSENQATLSEHVAGEIRAHLARQSLTMTQLADMLERPAMFVSRRLGGTRTVELTLEDVAMIADVLGVEPISLMPGSERLLLPT